MRRGLCAAAVMLAHGCVASAEDFARVDLTQVPRDKMIVIGTFRVWDTGRDQTGRSAIEVSSSSRGYKLPPSGDVAWIVDRPPAGQPLRLSWLATLESDQPFGNGFVFARADVREACSYFGVIEVRFRERREDELATAVVGMSFPEGSAEQQDGGDQHLARLAKVYPNLGGITCDGVVRGAAFRMPGNPR